MPTASDWTAGYVADIGYTFGYYSELNPLRVRHAFLDAGLAYPVETGAACELGFGQGVSLGIHAAASSADWWGTDFIPSQAAFAQELVRASGARAQALDQSFEEFCHRPDLPDFDWIGMHGIWSWVSEANRAVIVDFLRRKLKVGGVLYVSYNTMPGWATFAPVRDLLTEHAETIGVSGGGSGIVGRIDAALDFAQRLLATNPRYMAANPQVAARIADIKDKDRHYLAHEYFNRDWHPMPFARMAEWLRPAKLDYACSARWREHADVLNLSDAQQRFLQSIDEPLFRESVRDFMTNQQFRRDYWVKGARRLSALDRQEALRTQRLLLTSRRDEVSMKVDGAAGTVTMIADIYEPILDLLADRRPHAVAEIEEAARSRGVSFGKMRDAVTVLGALAHVQPVQDEAAVEAARPGAARLNRHLLARARSDGSIPYLASPVTGGGVDVGRFSQLFLLARERGAETPADWARGAWEALAAQGQSVRRNGKPLQGEADNVAELTAQAAAFAADELPLLQALGVA